MFTVSLRNEKEWSLSKDELKKESKYFQRLFSDIKPEGGWTEIHDNRCILDLPLFVYDQDMETFFYFMSNANLTVGPFWVYKYPILTEESSPCIPILPMPKPGNSFAILYVALYLEHARIIRLMRFFLFGFLSHHPTEAMDYAIAAHNAGMYSLRDELIDYICIHARTHVAWDLLHTATDDFRHILFSRKDFLPKDLCGASATELSMMNTFERDSSSIQHVVMFTNNNRELFHYFKIGAIMIRLHGQALRTSSDTWWLHGDMELCPLTQTERGMYFTFHGKYESQNDVLCEERIVFVPWNPMEEMTMTCIPIPIYSITADDEYLFAYGNYVKHGIDDIFFLKIRLVDLGTNRILTNRVVNYTNTRLVSVGDILFFIEKSFMRSGWKVVSRSKKQLCDRIIVSSFGALYYVGRIGTNVYFRTSRSFLGRNIHGEGLVYRFTKITSYIDDAVCWKSRIVFSHIKDSSIVQVRSLTPETDACKLFSEITAPNMVDGTSFFFLGDTLFITLSYNGCPLWTYKWNETKWIRIPLYNNKKVFFFSPYTSSLE
jgi:hypothetical protein